MLVAAANIDASDLQLVAGLAAARSGYVSCLSRRGCLRGGGLAIRSRHGGALSSVTGKREADVLELRPLAGRG